jgi:hypothetical protein
MRKIRNDRGVNTIAMVLMFISFFMIVGFGIGAISTMNLNLSGRAVNAVKANQISEGAVSQFITYVDQKTAELNESVPLNDLEPPSLELESYYNGSRHIFGTMPSYASDRSEICMYFWREGMAKPTGVPAEFIPYYSTDNSNNSKPVKGAFGFVPPFTFEVIINTRIGDFVKHYMVWVNRRWDYALYIEHGPVHLLSRMDYTGGLPQCEYPTMIKGNIYSRYDPLSFLAHYQYLYAFRNVSQSGNTVTYTDIMVENRIPSETFPAVINVGGKLWKSDTKVTRSLEGDEDTEEGQHEVITTVNSISEYCTSTGNCLDGRPVLAYRQPAKRCDRYVYRENNEDQIKGSLFDIDVARVFDRITLVNDDDANLINDQTYAGKLVKDANDYCGPLRGGPGSNLWGGGVIVGSFTVKKKKDKDDKKKGTGDDDEWESDGDAKAQAKIDELLASYYSKGWIRTVFFLKDNLKVNQTGQAAGSLNWPAAAKFVVKDETGYYPLVDRVIHLTYTFESEEGEKKKKYNIIEHATILSTEGRELDVTNSMVLAKANIELEQTNFRGDNSMLQVEGNLSMLSGQISAGENIGAVIYCNKLYCGLDGYYNGVILTKDSMKVSRQPGRDGLNFRGGIVMEGKDDAYDPAKPYVDIFDAPGFVSHGFNVEYDAKYVRMMNRFGKLRVACWREIN